MKKGIAMSTDLLIFVILMVVVGFFTFLLYTNIKAETGPASSSSFFLFVEWIVSIVPGLG